AERWIRAYISKASVPEVENEVGSRDPTAELGCGQWLGRGRDRLLQISRLFRRIPGRDH
ncbi:hypothetical protein U1Q18_022833, partial [Sarracenia purpurea var. burkii]